MSQSKNNLVAIRSMGAHAVKATAAAIVLVASFTTPSFAQGDPSQKQDSRISRAEVIADLALWRRAGVDRYELARSYSVETEQYRVAYAEYLRLRNSDEFQKEVRKVMEN